jgi:chaperonin GroES
MALNVKPIGDRILVEPAEEKETKKGGIIIPDTAKEKPQEGIVRVLGTGKVNDDGKKIAFEVKVGDRVLVSKYGGTEIKIDGKEYKLLSSDDILAILEEFNLQNLKLKTKKKLWQQNNYYSTNRRARQSCAASRSFPRRSSPRSGLTAATW